MKPKPWKTLSSRPIYENPWMHLREDVAEMPDERTTIYGVVTFGDCVGVVPFVDEDHVLLVRQYRHAAGDWLLEVPAGKLDPGESPETCARREVEEETGFRPERLIPMGWVFTTPGFTDEKIWLFAATDLEAARQELEHDEVLTIERLPLERAVALAANGEIRDGKSVCALLRVSHFIDGRC